MPKQLPALTHDQKVESINFVLNGAQINAVGGQKIIMAEVANAIVYALELRMTARILDTIGFSVFWDLAAEAEKAPDVMTPEG